MSKVSDRPDGRQATMSPVRRRRRNRDEMIGAILDAAREVMREDGVAALSMHEVARRVGVRAPSLYEYFAGKAALYDALFLLGVRLYAVRMDELLAGAAPSWDLFRNAFESYFRFAQECPELYRLVFERHVPGWTPSPESMEESRRMLERGYGAMADAIAAGIAAPDMPADRANDLFIAMMHGLTAAHMANEPELPLGQGRFGGLIPAAVELFRASWDPERVAAKEPVSSNRGPPRTDD